MKRLAYNSITLKLLQTISALAVSECGNFFAVGTMDGGVGIYDTHELKLLHFAQKTHGIFVTGSLFHFNDLQQVI